MDYGAQLEWKRRWVEGALTRRRPACPFPGAPVPSPSPDGYRNRLSLSVLDGRPGLHRRAGDRIDIGDCPLLHPAGRSLLAGMEDLFRGYSGRLHVRASFRDGRSCIEAEETLPPGFEPPGGTGAWVREAGGWAPASSMPPLDEEIAGIVLTVPPGGFFQVNTLAADLLVRKVTGGREPGRALDLFGGSGAFSLPLAAAGCDVTCVDMDGGACAAGRESASRAGLDARFVEEDCLSFLESLPPRSAFDLVLADPPRTGLGPGIAGALASLGAPAVVLVSCNPFTAARDLESFAGYHVASVDCFDLFPNTDHVETVIELRARRT
jgi:23S rRNA (uracil1939-C5)-methyltransferase